MGALAEPLSSFANHSNRPGAAFRVTLRIPLGISFYATIILLQNPLYAGGNPSLAKIKSWRVPGTDLLGDLASGFHCLR
jgi:hypothetical protein